MWFIFQKTKYLFDETTEKFKAVQFPVSHNFSHYQSSHGYVVFSDIAAAKQLHGKNRSVVCMCVRHDPLPFGLNVGCCFVFLIYGVCTITSRITICFLIIFISFIICINLSDCLFI